ncbi:MAG: signal recognition particle-docking protein FtsY [Nanoarchaeota archaeon]
MFSKFKEKLKNWAKSFTEKVEEKEKIKETPAEEIKEEKLEKPQKKEKKEKSKSKEETKEIPIPMEFEVGELKYEPDVEKLKEIKEKIEAKQETSYVEEEPEKRGFFSKVFSKISKIKISEKDFEEYSEDLKMLLIENNVAFEAADKIITELEKEIIGKEILKKELESEIKDSLRKIIEKILVDPFSIEGKIVDKKEKPYVILFCGINGTGKTTTIAKLAHNFKKQGLSCILAAGDTFRAASIEQIKKHGEKLGIRVISQDYGADPAAVGFDAINYAKKNYIDVVLIDTAGRMHSEKNLLKELEKIAKVCKPDLKIFVGESITGNDSIEQIKSFNETIGIGGIILTKADTDEKGGTALSVGYVTKKPILYLGIGQGYDSLIPFDKRKFLDDLGL